MFIEVDTYTDGSCKVNPGEGGWSYFLVLNKNSILSVKEIFGYELSTTNNRMEISSVINSVQSLDFSCRIVIYTYSLYLYDSIIFRMSFWERNNGKTFKGYDVKNFDLWKKLFFLLKDHIVSWRWVNSHNNNYGNEKADFFAQASVFERRQFWNC